MPVLSSTAPLSAQSSGHVSILTAQHKICIWVYLLTTILVCQVPSVCDRPQALINNKTVVSEKWCEQLLDGSDKMKQVVKRAS